MSEKKRRDITLGEMQDECKRFTDGLCGGKSCAYQDLCNQMKSGCTPHAWDLTDPPRFNERQMELLKAEYGIGAATARRIGENIFFSDRSDTASVSWISESVFGESELDYHPTLDLAELFGKEGVT